MPKSAKHKRERAADFKKAKLKLGKGKQLAQNATDTSIASKGISLPSQSLSTAGSKGSEPTSRRNLTLAELLIQSRHYSTPVKRQALQEALELITSYPHLIQRHLLALTTSLAHLVADPSASVRSCVRQLVHQLATQLPRASFVQVSAPPIVLYTLAALSALEDPIRIDALRLVDLLLESIPAELVRGFDPRAAVVFLDNTDDKDDSVTGPRILDSLLSLLKVRRNDQVEGASATLSDLSPEARLAVLSTLESFLAAASESAAASTGTDAWYLAGAFSSPEAFQDFLASSHHGTSSSSSSSSSSKSRPIEPYTALANVHANDQFALGALGLLTPSTTPTASSITSATKKPSLLALLHPTLLSSFLDSAPTALNPSAAATGSSSGGDHLATVTAVVAVARQLFSSELSGNGNGNAISMQATRRMLLAFLTHASPYFPFGADALASSSSSSASSRPTAAQQAEEAKFLSLNLAFAELSSLLVLSDRKSSTASERDGQHASKKGKGARRKVDADKGGVEVVVLDRVQEWVVQALRGELTTASSPMGTPLSPSAFESLTPTLWALLNQSDPARSNEVFSAVVDYFTRQQTNASVDGRTGEAKLRAGEFIARCVLIHSSPSYIAPFDLEPLASKLPATLSPNAKDTKQNALARWLVALPKYLWELGNAADPPREAEIELVLSVMLKLVQQGERGLIPRATLESLSPLLTPFFHLVHPKTHASHPGPFTRLDPSRSSASRHALDLVWYLAGPRYSSGAESPNSAVAGLVGAVERACALVGGEAAQRWESLRSMV